ncbi:MAG: hypothetical protein ACLPYW_12830 [Acidimicrobiales bacterium]
MDQVVRRRSALSVIGAAALAGSLLLPAPAGASATSSGRGALRHSEAFAAGDPASPATAPEAGSLTGVIERADGSPASRLCLLAEPVDAARSPLRSARVVFATTSSTGRYQLLGMVPGRYRVAADACRGEVARARSSGARRGGITFDVLVVAGAESPVPMKHLPPVLIRIGPDGHAPIGAFPREVRGELASGAGVTISGVIRSATGRALSGTCFQALSNTARSSYLAGGPTKHGRYSATGLPPGPWTVEFMSCGTANWAPQWWRDEPSAAKATILHLTAGQTASGIDGTLVPGGEISGEVETAAGQPVVGACVEASSRTLSNNTSTGAGGRYIIPALGSSRYSVQAGPGCGTNANLAPTALKGEVAVIVGKVSKAPKLALATGAVISGTVTSTASAPLNGICVMPSSLALDESDFLVGQDVVTGADGSYTIDQLPKGSYQLVFVTGECGNAGNYVTEYYPGVPDDFSASTLAIRAGETLTANVALRPGGSLEGRVVGPKGAGVPSCIALAYANVSFAPGVELGEHESSFYSLYGGATDNSGYFDVTQLPAAAYSVLALPHCNFPGTRDAPQYLGGTAGPPGRVVSIAAGGVVSGLRIVLEKGASLRGTFLAGGRRLAPPPDLAGLEAACLYLLQPKTGSLVISATVDPSSSGAYHLFGVPPGTYAIEGEPCFSASTSFAPGYYGGADRLSTAKIAVLRPGATLGSVDIDLPPTAVIEGSVASSDGKPVPYACVSADSADQSGYATTRPDGDFKIEGIGRGSYEMYFSQCVGRVSLAAAELSGVHASDGRITTGIDAELRPGGSVSGTLLDSLGEPLGGVCVDAVSPDPSVPGSGTEASAGGTYSIMGVPAGDLKIVVYPDCLVALGLASRQIRSVSVSAGKATVAPTVTLVAEGSISGVVLGTGSIRVAGACVIAVPLGATVYAADTEMAETGSNGDYDISELASGNYAVEFTSGCGATGYATQWWDASSSQSAATPVRVKQNSQTAGIDATLSAT